MRILHVVHEARRYQAKCWLLIVNVETIWRAMRLRRIYVYLGPPNVVTHNARKQFVAQVFEIDAELLRIHT